ncbi:SDR family oxidoreductase [Aquirufa nivalisilvae]
MFNPSLYNHSYHSIDLSKHSILVTGGAGFIGSNLVEYLLKYNAKHIRILDNLSNGYFENINEFLTLPNVEFIQGDIRDFKTCVEAVKGIEFVSHQAALGSVPRSISDPITTNEVNISGFLNMLTAVKENKQVKRFVYAASSSTYGDSKELPKVEGIEGKPLSPYAVTKLVNELYADVFSKVYGVHAIGLRYFNVFGPKQNPNNAYAAVIPLFCKNFIEGRSPTINGDGETSRDFTFVENVIQANIKAFEYNALMKHEVYNTACGDQISLNEMIKILRIISGKEINANFTDERQGDIKHSLASIELITKKLGYQPQVKFKEGLQLAYDYYLKNEKI